MGLFFQYWLRHWSSAPTDLLLLFVDAGDDNVHLLPNLTIWDDAASKRAGVLDLCKQPTFGPQTVDMIDCCVKAHSVSYTTTLNFSSQEIFRRNCREMLPKVKTLVNVARLQ